MLSINCHGCGKDVSDDDEDKLAWIITGPETSARKDIHHKRCMPRRRLYSWPLCQACDDRVTSVNPGVLVGAGIANDLYHTECAPVGRKNQAAMKPYGTHVAEESMREAVRETCWTCGVAITETDPGEKLYDGDRLVSIKHNRCDLAPLKDALSELEDGAPVKALGPGSLSVAPVVDPDDVAELQRRSKILEKVMNAVVSRIDASGKYFPWESERRARKRLAILVTLVLLVALAALLVSAVSLWRTL